MRDKLLLGMAVAFYGVGLFVWGTVALLVERHAPGLRLVFSSLFFATVCLSLAVSTSVAIGLVKRVSRLEQQLAEAKRPEAK